MAIEMFDPNGKHLHDLPVGVRKEYRETCSDPQCNDSTWDHACNLGESLGTYRFRMRNALVRIYPGDYIVNDKTGEAFVLSPDMLNELKGF